MADPDTLLAEVLDGDADAATLERLAGLVRTDAQLRERFLAQVAIAGALRARHLSSSRLDTLRRRTLENLVNAGDLARTGRSVLDRLPPPPPPRGRRHRWLPAVGVAAAAVVVVLLLIPGPSSATVQGMGRDALLVRQGLDTAVVAGMALQNGDRLGSGSQPLTITFRDGTTLALPAASELLLERVAAGKRLRLLQGQVQAQVVKQPAGEPLLALTARSVVTVVGTRFRLATSSDSDFVAVQEGEVAVERHDGMRASLRDGRAVVVTADQPLIPVAIARSTATDPDGAGSWSGTGSGLRGDYYADHAFNRLTGSRIDPQIRFEWPGSPIDTVPVDHFTVRWSGRLQPRVSGEHIFTIRADDGVRLWIDGRLLIDTWHTPDIADQRGLVTLSAGRLYDLRLDYFDNNQAGEITLWWQAPGQVKEVVPASQLYPP